MRRTAWLLAVIVSAASADTLIGQVTAVTGGDTLRMTDAHSHAQFSVRLAAVQAPDRLHSFGGRAEQNLGALVFGHDVRIEGESPSRDGVVVGKVMVATPGCQAPQCPRDIDVGLEQVKAGLAWWVPQRAAAWTAEERGRYQHAEFQAKIHRLGLWAGRDSFPPWEAKAASPSRR
jgi:micrococcal nuclease